MEHIGTILNGAYRIAEKLREDWSCQVYRAHGLSGGDAVDATIIKPEALSGRLEGAIRFRSEMETVRGFDHPAIVRALQAGEQFGTVYVVSARCDAPQLSGVMRDAAGDVPRALALLVDLCRALAYAHGRGVLHRGIRPDAVMAGRDGAMLAGFGLAHVVESAAATSPEDRATLFGYLAPEQSGLIRKRVDERSDLYQLGVLLYHLTTGRLPITGDSVTAIVHRHLTQVPEPPARVNTRLPAVLDRIIMRLLEKDPDRRYQSATGLCADLERLIGGNDDFIPGLDDHASRIELGGPLIGRETEFERLTRLYERTRRGRCAVCVIDGPPGSGKTRLVEEFVDHVRGAGGAIMTGRCVSQGPARPYGPLSEALAGYAAAFAAYPDERRAAIRARTAEEFPSLRSLVATLCPAITGVIGEGGAVEPIRAEREGARFLEVAARLFCVLADCERGLALIVDDAHWADEGTMAILAAALSARGDHPLMIVLTRRGGPGGDDGFVPGTHARAIAERISLGPFDEATHERFVARILRDEGDDVRSIARRIFPHSGGVPFLSLELVRRYLDDGALSYLDGRWHADRARLASIDAGGGDRDVLLARIAGLDDDDRDILSVAALIGRSFRPELVAAVSGREVARVLGAIDRAGDRALIEPDAGEAYAFMHDRIREAFCAGLPGERTRALHRAAAETLARSLSDDDDATLFEIAHHAIEAGERALIVRWASRAAVRARARYALESAGRYLREVLRHLERDGDGDARALFVSATVELGEIAIVTGRTDEGVETLRGILPRIDDDRTRATAYRLLTDACYRRGDWAGCEENAARGLRLLGERLPRTRGRVVAGILRELGVHAAHVLLPAVFVRASTRGTGAVPREIVGFYEPLSMSYGLNDPLRLVRCALRILNIAERRIGPSPELAKALSGYASVCMAIPLFARARRYHRRALALNESLGFEGGIAKSCELMGYFYEWTGDFTAARLSFQRSLDIYRRLGDAKEYAMVLNGLEHCHYYAGEYWDALEVNQRYRSSAALSDDAYAMSAADIYYSQIYREQGDLEAANRHAGRARDLSRDRAIPFNYCSSLVELGMNALEAGEIDSARTCLEEARALHERGNFLRQYIVPVYPALAQAHLDEFLRDEGGLTPEARKRRMAGLLRISRLAARKTRRWRTHHGTALRIQAQCHAIAGRHAEAAALFARSIALCRELGRRFETARGLYECGMFRAHTGDDRVSRPLLEEAYRLFSELGAQLHASRIALVLGIRGTDDRETPLKRLMGRERAQAAGRIGREIGGAASEEALLDLMAARTLEMTGARGCVIYLGADGDGAPVRRHERGEVSPDANAHQRALAASVYSAGEFLLDAGPPVGGCALLCAPIRGEGGVTGACCIEGPADGIAFTVEDGEFLSDIYATAAMRLQAGFGAARPARTRGAERDGVTPGTEEKLNAVIAYIGQNYRDELSREGLAAMVGMSPNHLGKYFAIVTGRKIGDYINELRVRDAAAMLDGTSENIIDIAFAVGFESLRTFNRAFLKVMNVTPTEYRERT